MPNRGAWWPIIVWDYTQQKYKVLESRYDIMSGDKFFVMITNATNEDICHYLQLNNAD